MLFFFSFVHQTPHCKRWHQRANRTVIGGGRGGGWLAVVAQTFNICQKFFFFGVFSGGVALFSSSYIDKYSWRLNWGRSSLRLAVLNSIAVLESDQSLTDQRAFGSVSPCFRNDARHWHALEHSLRPAPPLLVT